MSVFKRIGAKIQLLIECDLRHRNPRTKWKILTEGIQAYVDGETKIGPSHQTLRNWMAGQEASLQLVMDLNEVLNFHSDLKVKLVPADWADDTSEIVFGRLIGLPELVNFKKNASLWAASMDAANNAVIPLEGKADQNAIEREYCGFYKGQCQLIGSGVGSMTFDLSLAMTYVLPISLRRNERRCFLFCIMTIASPMCLLQQTYFGSLSRDSYYAHWMLHQQNSDTRRVITMNAPRFNFQFHLPARGRLMMGSEGPHFETLTYDFQLVRVSDFTSIKDADAFLFGSCVSESKTEQSALTPPRPGFLKSA